MKELQACTTAITAAMREQRTEKAKPNPTTTAQPTAFCKARTATSTTSAVLWYLHVETLKVQADLCNNPCVVPRSKTAWQTVLWCCSCTPITAMVVRRSFTHAHAPERPKSSMPS